MAFDLRCRWVGWAPGVGYKPRGVRRTGASAPFPLRMRHDAARRRQRRAGPDAGVRRSVAGQDAGLLGERAQLLLGALEALAERGGAAIGVVVVAGHGARDVAPRHAAVDAQDEQRVVVGIELR